jgi:hypothetical protein
MAANNSMAARLVARILCGAGYAVVSPPPERGLSFRPAQKVRGEMARQVAQPLFFDAAFPRENAGASRRAIAAFFFRRRAALFGGRLNDRRQPSSWQAAHSGQPGGAPTPPECVLAKHARRRRIPFRLQDASGRRPSTNETSGI